MIIGADCVKIISVKNMYFDLNDKIVVTGFGRIVQNSGFWHGIWCRRYYTMFFISEGGFTMELNGKRYVLNKGDTLIVPPDTSYKPLESNGCVYYYFYFLAKETELRDSRFSISASHCTNPQNFSYGYKYTLHSVVELDVFTPSFEGSRMHKVMARCAELDVWQRPFEKMLLDNYLKEALILLGTFRLSESEVEQRFSRMVIYIRNHYKNNIGLTEVAGHVHMSKSYAAKIFRKNSGMRCCDYINQVRLSAACELLTNTSMRVSDIAEAVGYSGQYYFARQFRKVYGMTALQFRKNGTE